MSDSDWSEVGNDESDEFNQVLASPTLAFIYVDPVTGRKRDIDPDLRAEIMFSLGGVPPSKWFSIDAARRVLQQDSERIVTGRARSDFQRAVVFLIAKGAHKHRFVPPFGTTQH